MPKAACRFGPTATGESSTTNIYPDFATIAYSNTGIPLWTNRYDGLGNDEDIAKVVAVDRNGNVLVAGDSWNGTNIEYVTIKYSSSVPLPHLDFQLLSNQLVLNWTNAGFNLQTAPALTGTFTNLPGSFTLTAVAPKRRYGAPRRRKAASAWISRRGWNLARPVEGAH